MVTLLSKPNCIQCSATEKALTNSGIGYTKIDVTQDAEALEMIRGLGYLQVPVVMAGDVHWSGFRPERIAELAA
jgi:glutaredoxin-like protein NrdH